MGNKKFNAKWYLEKNPDVAASGMDPLEHYIKFGEDEGRRPCPPSWSERLVVRSKVILEVVSWVAAKEGGYFRACRKFLFIFATKKIGGLKAFILHTHMVSKHNVLPYEKWIEENELAKEDLQFAKSELANMDYQPLISIIMPTYNSNIKWLEEAIHSIKKQVYSNWELCIADDASSDANLKLFLEQQKIDPRIKITYREINGHISRCSNSAADLASGEWLVLFDHDDLLHEYALFWLVTALNRHPNALLLYSDEDKIDEHNVRHDPYFKSDWNYDLFLSQNCFSHLGVIKKSLFEKIEGFREGYEGSQDHDLILRAIDFVEPNQIIHIPKVLYHWRVHEHSTAKNQSSKPYAAIAGEKAIFDHITKHGLRGSVAFEGYGYRVRYELPNPSPLVSILIPTRNGLHLLSQCIDSIVQKTNYENYEIIVIDNGSDESETISYLNELKKLPNFLVLKDDRPFNYSQLNNYAAKHAKGELICLLNNDIEVIAPDWLGEMVSHAVRPGIGAVGAKLLFPDGTLQHGGVIVGVGGVANHAHLGFPRGHDGYFARMKIIQQFSAVTAACLLIKKSVYEEACGLDEVNLTVAFNDVDFCLRIRQLGYQNLWTPYAELFHHESATRGADDNPVKRARFLREVEYMTTNWSKELNSDPYFNINLSLDYPDFTWSNKPRLAKTELKIN